VASKADQLFAEIALRNSLLTKKQIDECLKLVDRPGPKGPKGLAEAVERKGYLTAAQVASVSRAQNYREVRLESKLYGRIAIKNGLATSEDVASCLELQKRAYLEGEPPPDFGQLLEERGCCTAEENRAIREVLRKLDAETYVARKEPGKPLAPSPERGRLRGKAPLAPPDKEISADEEFIAEDDEAEDADRAAFSSRTSDESLEAAGAKAASGDEEGEGDEDVFARAAASDDDLEDLDESDEAIKAAAEAEEAEQAAAKVPPPAAKGGKPGARPPAPAPPAGRPAPAAAGGGAGGGPAAGADAPTRKRPAVPAPQPARPQPVEAGSRTPSDRRRAAAADTTEEIEPILEKADLRSPSVRKAGAASSDGELPASLAPEPKTKAPSARAARPAEDLEPIDEVEESGDHLEAPSELEEMEEGDEAGVPAAASEDGDEDGTVPADAVGAARIKVGTPGRECPRCSVTLAAGTRECLYCGFVLPADAAADAAGAAAAAPEARASGEDLLADDSSEEEAAGAKAAPAAAADDAGEDEEKTAGEDSVGSFLDAPTGQHTPLKLPGAPPRPAVPAPGASGKMKPPVAGAPPSGRAAPSGRGGPVSAGAAAGPAGAAAPAAPAAAAGPAGPAKPAPAASGRLRTEPLDAVYDRGPSLWKGPRGELFRAKAKKGGAPALLWRLPKDVEPEEAQVTAALEDAAKLRSLRLKHAVETVAIGKDAGGFYAVLEEAPGKPASAAVPAGKGLERLRAARIAKELATALDAAARGGVHHRDIRPELLLLADDAEAPPRLLGFGVARLLEPPAKGAPSVADDPYSAPERQRKADRVDVKTDLYGLGALATFLFTGEPPKAKALPDVPGALKTFLQKTLDPTSGRRYADFGKTLFDLNRAPGAKGVEVQVER